MGSELGTVVSTFEGPTTGIFAFVVTGNGVRKGQFVQAGTEDGLLIGNVTEIARANRYFERAESVADYEKSAPISASFPSADWDYAIAKVRALGIFKNGVLARSLYPAAPGAKVFPADSTLLKEFLGFAETGLHVGDLQNNSLSAKFDASRLFQKHLAILAMSGAGKSYLCGVLIEELLDRKAPDGRLAVILIDPHGEYSAYSQGDYADRTSVFDCSESRIALRKVSSAAFAEWVPHLSHTQRRELSKILAEMKLEMKNSGQAFDLNDLMARIEAAEMKENIKDPLLAWLSELKSLKLFAKGEKPKVAELCVPGKLSVLDMSSIDNLRKKQMLVSYFAKRLFRMRKNGEIPPFVLLIEEAHNFCKEKAEKSAAISKGIIETVAREGRKFGASLCLVSQRPVQLSTTALSQCNTQIILRVTNPYDLKHIAESCEGIDNETLGTITTLRVGDALVIGEAVNYPVFVRVRKRRSKVVARGESLADMARKFEEEKAKKKEDVGAFI